MKKYIIAFLSLAIIGMGAGYYMYNKPHADMASMKEDLRMDASELFAAFESNESQANQKYLDKVIVVSGTVNAISDSEGGTSITLDSDSDMFGVVCQLDEQTDRATGNFEVGERVIFKGICTGKLMDVVLVRCIEQKSKRS